MIMRAPPDDLPIKIVRKQKQTEDESCHIKNKVKSVNKDIVDSLREMLDEWAKAFIKAYCLDPMDAVMVAYPIDVLRPIHRHLGEQRVARRRPSSPGRRRLAGTSRELSERRCDASSPRPRLHATRSR